MNSVLRQGALALAWAATAMLPTGCTTSLGLEPSMDGGGEGPPTGPASENNGPEGPDGPGSGQDRDAGADSGSASDADRDADADADADRDADADADADPEHDAGADSGAMSCPNLGFEDWADDRPSGFDLTSRVSASREAVDVHGGALAARMTWASTTNQELSGAVECLIAFESGETGALVFRAWVLDSDPQGRVRLGLRYYDALRQSLGSAPWPNHYSEDAPGWQRLVLEDVPPAGAAFVSPVMRFYDVSPFVEASVVTDDWDLGWQAPDAGSDADADTDADADADLDADSDADADADADSDADADADADSGCRVVLNELEYDEPGTDAAEFAELRFLGDFLGKSVNACGVDRVVFFNHGACSAYRAAELPGDAIPGDGLWVLGPEGLAGVDQAIGSGSNLIQNGDPDGVLLMQGDAIVAAYVYEGESACPELLFALAIPGQTNDAPDLSSSRCDNGSWTLGTPTPGEPND